jgi:hypothetical protein
MRNSDGPVFQAARQLDDALSGPAAIPNATPLTQLIWATFLRSKRTYEAISHLIGHELDTQAAMLCRSLFEDMLVSHWLALNDEDPQWLIDRFFRHRDAMELGRLAIEEDYGWSVGPRLVEVTPELRARKNELGQEFKRQARRDWWDPCDGGRGAGRSIGIAGIARILEGAAANHQRFDPRFAGGEAPLLRNLEAVVLSWFSRQLHHTAVGLPFQPSVQGPIERPTDPRVPLLILFSAYWIFGQQGYLLLEHLDEDVHQYDQIFIRGLVVIGSELAPEAVHQRPPRPYQRPTE